MKIEKVVCKGKTFSEDDIKAGLKNTGKDLSKDYMYEMYCDGYRVFLIKMGHFALVEFPDLIGCIGFDPYTADSNGVKPRDLMMGAIKGIPTVETHYDWSSEIDNIKKKAENDKMNKQMNQEPTNDEVCNLVHGIFQYEWIGEDESVDITIDKNFLKEMESELERFQDMKLYDKFIDYTFEIEHDYGRYDNDASIVTYNLTMVDIYGNTYRGELRHSLMGGFKTDIIGNPVDIHEF